jgi:phosphate transport system permease protein
MVPFLLDIFPGQMTYGTSWLAASILLGIMALPTIISVADDAMRSVPRSYREASMAVGATRWETTRKVVIPASLSGISAAIMLGVGRAIGETMVVVMVAGNAPLIPEPLWNVFEGIRTITATLALEMAEVSVGDVHYSALFLLALILMGMVLLVNFATRFITENTRRNFERGGGSFGKRLPGRIRNAAGLAKRPLMLTFLFIFALMMSSLVFDIVISSVTAFAFILFVISVPHIARLIKPLSRQKVAHSVMATSMFIAGAFLLAMLLEIIIKGAPAISLDFLTGVPSDAGRDGGILPAILGTIELIAGTALIALPLGITTGIYLSEFSKDTRFTRIVRMSIDTLNGTPSIVFGLFGMVAIVIFLGIGESLLAGCMTLAFLILPVIIRTTEEALKAVPYELREASLAMGATKWETTVKIVVPAAMGGVLTGVILSLGRAGGETAPIMFTAVVVSRRYLEFSFLDPVMALPYHLYYLASEVPNSSEAQYGTALVLMIIVLAMFTFASVVRHHYSKKVRW